MKDHIWHAATTNNQNHGHNNQNQHTQPSEHAEEATTRVEILPLETPNACTFVWEPYREPNVEPGFSLFVLIIAGTVVPGKGTQKDAAGLQIFDLEGCDREQGQLPGVMQLGMGCKLLCTLTRSVGADRNARPLYPQVCQYPFYAHARHAPGVVCCMCLSASPSNLRVGCKRDSRQCQCVVYN